jgi:predicted nuclease of predicted toxin-antitoxin system
MASFLVDESSGRSVYEALKSDKDFGELVYRLRQPATGVILLRLEDERPANKVCVLRQVLEQREAELHGYFTVAREETIKTRKIQD